MIQYKTRRVAENAGCIPGDAFGGVGNLIDGHYKTPYAIHTSGGVQHAFNQHWTLAADYTHEEGNHGYRAYSFTGGTNLFTPLIPASIRTMAPIRLTLFPTSIFSSPTTARATTR